MELSKLLKTLELFNGLSETELKEISNFAIEQNYKEGEEIFHEESLESDLYILNEGRVQVKVALNKREEATIHTILPGKLFGEFAFIDKQPRSATAISISNSNVFRLKREDMIQLFEKNNHIGYIVMKQMSFILARRIRQTAHALKISLIWDHN
jgi:CRP/FNR family cyclic AMP-dependent transcriptional regulator